jgi:peptidoglycan/LPS O-acetylase OafA/YrhL
LAVLHALKNGLFAPVPTVAKTFSAIDGFRAFAALAVIVFHYKNFAAGGGVLTRPWSVFDQVGVIEWLALFRTHGGLAVMAFWSISGFVFMCNYAGTRPAGREFLLKRFARLYPLHLITLLVVAAIQIIALLTLDHSLVYHGNDVGNFIAHLFLVSGWGYEGVPGFNYPIWSVSMEVLIYALFYLFIKYSTPRLATLIALCLAFQIAAVAISANLIIVCGAYFFAGAATYALYAHLHDARPRLLAVIGAALILAAEGAIAAGHWISIPTTLWLLPATQGVLIMLACIQTDRNERWLRWGTVLGNGTYSSYLWHMPMLLLFLLGAGLGLWSVDAAFSGGFLIAYLVLVCAVSAASYQFIERPAQKLILRRASKTSHTQRAVTAAS